MKQQDFFSQNLEHNIQDQAPLAVKMRPETLDEFIGQQHIIGPGKILRRLIAADKLSSVIFYGPPGTGKTSLAKIIANTTRSEFYELNAVTSGKKDIEEVLEKARTNLSVYNKRSILFIDEIHRFNKAQQDLLLPGVEQGLIVLIGATTENPSFEVNSPLLSRSTLFEFRALTLDEVKGLLKRAIKDPIHGFGTQKIALTEEAADHLSVTANGDVRRALNAVELAVLTKEKNEDGIIVIDLETAQDCIQKKAVNYDKKGDNHYDTISAFIKSIRGTDPDAAMYWLAKMLEAGEDPKFIARRLVISASEDIGNAEPQALVVAVAAAQAVAMIGLPEARINLAQATAFLASAPKSNAAYAALGRAQQAVRHESDSQVPPNLINIDVPGSRKLERGSVYLYPHDYKENYVPQQYLPEDISGRVFYEPTENGAEAAIKEHLTHIRSLKGVKK